MLRLGFSVRATPSTTTMVFCSSRSCGWVCMLNCAVTSNSWVRSRAMEISFAARSMIGSPMARIACAKTAGSWSRGTYPASKCTSLTLR